MKAKIDFVLEYAAWPALLAEESGRVRYANQAAVAAFGAVLEGEAPLLSALWAPDNETTPEQLMARLERSLTAVVPIRYRSKSGDSVLCNTYACLQHKEGQKLLLLQFFRDNLAPGTPATVAASAPAGTPAGAATPAGGKTPLSTQLAALGLPAAAGAETGGQTIDSNVAQKQKLDCALQLIRTVVLDFNNALTSILGHTSLVLGKMEGNHPWRNSLLEVEKSAEKAAEIAHDLAAFSRQEKETRATTTAGNLNDLLRRASEAMQKPGGPPIGWSLDLENKLYSVNFDEAKMQQAFIKILENSVQAVGQQGDIVIRTRNFELAEPFQDGTASLAAGFYVCVDIADNGCGIAPEVLPRIFEPFFTTKAGHRGLGLAWLYGIITNHGGSVSVSSQLERGTNVRLYLPAQKKIVKDKAVKTDDLGGNQTILMVDDEDLLLTMGQMVLSSFGYQVLTANSGEEALNLFNRAGGKVDLVITDMVMPNMSGRELIERLRKVSPHVQIICSSGFVRPNTAEEDDNYLQKPFTSQELLRHVKSALA